VNDKTKQALLGAVLTATLATGCGIVIDAQPWHVFGTAIVVAVISFAMDWTS
jgi:hypothetical protein